MGATESEHQRLPTNGPFFPHGSSAIFITNIFSQTLVSEIVDTVQSNFTLPVSQYIKMHADAYRKIVSKAQDQLNKRNLTYQLAHDRIDLIVDILASKKILIQRNLHLRATRPQIKNLQEYIGWHRESFYGRGVERCVNFWVPVANVTSENSLQYIPNSHLIPDDRLGIVRVEDPITAKQSAGHLIGLPYAPKHIVSGVDLSQRRAFDVGIGEAAIFSGSLIHGAAENRSNNIRFSLDFRLIASEAYGSNELHTESANNCFVPLQ